MEFTVYFWIAAIIVFIIVEAATVNLVSLWFIAGSVAALLCAVLHAPLWLQIAVFLAVSAILLLLLRPITQKYLNPKITKTNADRLIGQQALVCEAIDNLRQTGAVKIGGIEWSARSADESEIPVGTKIRILRIEGVKVYVEAVQTPAVIS